MKTSLIERKRNMKQTAKRSPDWRRKQRRSTVSSKFDGASAKGRTPPPAEYLIPKGKSGNYKGRPKGAVSLNKLTKNVANRKIRAIVDGVKQNRTVIALVVL